MQKQLDELTKEFESFFENAKKQIEKGNKAAGLRSRNASLKLRGMLKDWRLESLND